MEGDFLVEKICVLGIGRVGLPLSLAFVDAGFTVYGIDINEDYLNILKKGQMPFIEKGTQDILNKHLNKKFFPSSDNSLISKADIIIVTLGTPVDDHLNPDYSQLNSIIPTLIKYLKKEQQIILRSTVAPGTTEFLKDQIEKKTGLVAGIDFYLSFCPERIAQGKALEEIKEVPQLIGGVDKKSSIKAKELFLKITSQCLISDSKSVELAKILTNMYRYINFAIANEFTILAMENERNIYEILNLINKDYKRGGVPQPGFTAGPCLYKDGFFLLNNIPFNELISVSWRINENLPLYLLKKIKEKVDLKGKKAVILGMAFKKNIDDTRNSLSYKLKKALVREQCTLALHDPFISKFNVNIEKVLRNADIVVIAMNHTIYENLNKEYLKKFVNKDCIICDPWNIADGGQIIYSL